MSEKNVTPGDVGKAKVEHEDVGTSLGREGDRVGTCPRLADDLEATTEAERRADQTAHVVDIVDEDHRNQVWTRGVHYAAFSLGRRRTKVLVAPS